MANRRITLIRHGQAGSRLLYDQLSPLGHLQARALGQWWAGRKTTFDCVISGALARQHETALGIASEIECKGLISDGRWNEFDLDAVYDGLKGHLSRDDEQFRLEYEQLLLEMADPAHAVHRAWRNCDTTVVRAWMESRYQFEGETWPAFVGRIRSALEDLPHCESVAIVTSATPIAICAATVLELSPWHVMHLAAALYNTSFTELRGEDLRLISFNNAPHLEDSARTHR